MDSIPQPLNPFIAASGGLQLPSLQEVFLLPGDWVIYLLSAYASPVAAALNIGPADYGGGYAAAAALVCWVAVLILAIVVGAAVRNWDRAVTRWLAELRADLLRRVRMVIALAAYRRRQRNKRIEPTLDPPESGELKPSSDSHLYE
jgi:hypothetical protein